jgi:DNA-binding NarL/FixJ family response regulator
MARYSPRSQNQELMAEKRRVARRLLAQGLTVHQIAAQLNCSPVIVRGVRDELVASHGQEGLAASC